ncbi:hypothetical protein HDU96_008780 [Phlyctochytrium bullatum]|nr:hypothetical protein HDU96_008780 [Phlyctochytrium bullatum]
MVEERAEGRDCLSQVDSSPSLDHESVGGTQAAIDETVYDILCVGFGPSGVSIAVALADATRRLGDKPLNVCFVERNEKFVWHGDMMIEDTRMQISFIKDLATLRNPTSHFTFLNYLHKQDRLLPFLNTKTFNPYRVEYNAYMEWVANHFNDHCKYGEEVVRIDPVLSPDGSVERLTVLSRRLNDNSTVLRTSRNVILAIGGKPRIPEWAYKPLPSMSARHAPKVLPPGIVHACYYLRSVARLLPERETPYRIAVVGAGQSAAEIFMDLVGRYPNAQISMIFRDEALRPADDSPFVNEVVFDPDQTDVFYKKSDRAKSAHLERNRSTNYAVVNLDLIERIYALLYKQKLPGGIERHRIFHECEVVSIDVDERGGVTGGTSLVMRVQRLKDYDAACSPTATGTTPLNFDAVILCTGYERTMHRKILRTVLPFVEPELPASVPGSPSSTTLSIDTACGGADAEECQFLAVELDPIVERDYRVRTLPSFKAGIYLQGCCERSHGLSDTLLSVLAVRNVEVVSSLISNDPELSSAFQVVRDSDREEFGNPAISFRRKILSDSTADSSSPAWTWELDSSAGLGSGVLRPSSVAPALAQQHPIPPAGHTVYSRAVAIDGRPSQLSFRVIHPDKDLVFFHTWMNNPRVSFFWREQGSLQKHQDYISNMLQNGNHCNTIPLIACFDGNPFAYFEVYDAAQSSLRGRYAIDPRTGVPQPLKAPQDSPLPGTELDRGIHMLVGEEKFRGPHRVAAWLPSLVDYAFSASPYGTQTKRIVSEPRCDNLKMVGYLESIGGFENCGLLTLSHKTAILMSVSRTELQTK